MRATTCTMHGASKQRASMLHACSCHMSHVWGLPAVCTATPSPGADLPASRPGLELLEQDRPGQESGPVSMGTLHSSLPACSWQPNALGVHSTAASQPAAQCRRGAQHSSIKPAGSCARCYACNSPQVLIRLGQCSRISLGGERQAPEACLRTAADSPAAWVYAGRILPVHRYHIQHAAHRLIHPAARELCERRVWVPKQQWRQASAAC